MRLLGHYLLLFGALLLTALGEKLLFALYHAPLRRGLGVGELLATLAWGVRFDLAVAALLTLLAWALVWLLIRLLRQPPTRAFALGGGLALASLVGLSGGDMLYFHEAGRHLGYELRDTLGSGGELALTALQSFPWMTLTQLGLMAALVTLYVRLGRRLALARAGWGLELSLLPVLLVSALLLRGGLQSVPLEPLHAQQIGDSRKATLTLNGAYNALFSSVTPYSVKPLLTTEPTPAVRARIAALYPASSTAVVPNAEPPNLVIVLLESWSGVYTGSYDYPLDTTPQFDALRAEGLSARAVLAGGNRTTEGMFATLCSAQNPLGGTVAQTQLQNYPYRCLPHLLREQGYSSAFFQGTLVNTSGTGAFANLLGFERNFGKGDLADPQLAQNSWGLHDPDLYRMALDQMRQLPRPFLVGINTNTTHDSLLPPGVAPGFPGVEPPAVNTIHFADAALGDFIRAVRTDPALHNTLFVLVADHCGSAPPGGYQRHRIPLAIVGPGVTPRVAERIATQRDIAPTVLELLGQPPAPWFSGKSLLHDDQGPYGADYYHAGLLGWAVGEHLTVQPIRAPDQVSCFRPLADPDLRHPVACVAADHQAAEDARRLTGLWQGLLFSGRTQHFGELR